MKNGIYEIFYRFYFDYLRIKRDILPRLRQRYLPLQLGSGEYFFFIYLHMR